MLVDKGVGSLVAGGGHENDNIVAHTGRSISLSLFLDVEELFATTLDTIETGIDDKGVAQSRHFLEPTSQCIERDALCQHLLSVTAFQLNAARQYAVLTLESTYFTHVNATGHKIGSILDIADAVSGIVDDDMHIATLCLNDILQPVDALVVYFLAAGVMQHFHMAGRNTQRVDKVLMQHVAVVACKVAVG